MMARHFKIRSLLLLVPVLLQANPPPAAPVAPAAPAASVPAAPAPSVAEEPALVALRNAHLATLKARQDAVLKKEIETLRAMEAARVAQGDYLGAEQAAQALQGLEKASPGTAQKGAAWVLDGRLAHSVSFGATAKQGSFQMNKANAVVRWESVVMPAGRYQVKMTYQVDAPINGFTRPIGGSGVKSASQEIPAFGGTVTFGEVTSINGSEALKFRVSRTTQLVEKTTVDLGFITTSTSRPTFAFKATEALSEGVLTLLALELVPAAAAAVPTPVSLESKEFTTVQEEYRKQMQEKTAGANKFWLTKLQELFKSATDSANTEALELIKPELNRMTLLLNPAAAAVVATNSDKILLPAFDPIVATFNSEIRISNNKDCLQRLRPAGARVSFKLAAAKVPAGRYQVTLNINSGAGMGGAYLITCGNSQVGGVLEGASSMVRRSIAISKPLVITSDAKYLEFSVESLALSTGSLCELRSIELTPEK